MRIYMGRHGTRVSMGPWTAMAYYLLVYPFIIGWQLVKLAIPIFVLIAVGTWKLLAWAYRQTADGARILRREFHHHDEARDL